MPSSITNFMNDTVVIKLIVINNGFQGLN